MSKSAKEDENTLPEQPVVVAAQPARADVDKSTKSPREWFAALAPAKESPRERTNRLGDHNAAATMHSWKDHRHHFSRPVQLSRSDYEGALKAAASGKGRRGIYMPAISDEMRKIRAEQELQAIKDALREGRPAPERIFTK